MKELFQQFSDYLQKTLGINSQVEPWPDPKKLPLLLRELYEVASARILDRQYIIIIPHSDQESTPSAAIAKHVSTLWVGLSQQAIYVSQTISSYHRKRLIEQRIPFVIPGNQLYLPDLGMDLREHFRMSHIWKKKFTPSTQLLVCYALKKHEYGPWRLSELAAKLGYTKMTISRACNEIESSETGIVISQGRDRLLHFEKRGKDLWEQLKPYLRSPVQRKLWVHFPQNLKHKFPAAGLTALAMQTMIAEPYYETVATMPETWQNVSSRFDLELVPSRELGGTCVEIWNYDPELLAEKGQVDSLSLYQSLRNEPDERITQALDHMMEAVDW